MFYPIAMDVNAAPTFWKTMKNVYKQQRRWAYGMGDIPYYLFAFWKNKKIPLCKKFSLGGTVFEGFWSWSVSSIVIFFLGWLPVVLGGHNFSQTLLSYNLPLLTSRILTVSMLGLLGSAYYNIMLLPPKPIDYGKKKYLFFVLEWFLLPIVMIAFTSIPALDAQTRWMLGKYMGFWVTEKTRK
jgi:cellulose synthase/poly-beta-1,6-N-acetylglucosamine synthase-like glycosyltransferase